MGLDPTLITNALAQYQQPQDPLTRYAKLQALQNGIMQQQATQQQLQTGAIDLQEKQQQISGQKALADAIKANVTAGPDGAPAINHTAVVQALGAGGHGELISGYMAGVQKQQQDQAALKKTQLENQTNSLDLVARSVEGATDQASWDKAIATMHGLGVDSAQLGVPPVYSPEAKAAVLAHGESYKDHLASQAAAITANARAKTADIAGDRLSDERIERALNSAAGATNQDELDAARNQALKLGANAAQVNAIPMQFSPDAMKAYRTSRLTPDQAVTTAATAARDTATEADRKVTQDQRNREIAISQGRLGVEQQRFKAETGAQGNEALANVPLNQRNAALADALKVGNEAATASHAADEMNDLINLARSGNKVAYAYSPVTGVLTINSANGSKRVNLNEIQAYEGAGSAVDAIKGWFGKKATGASIDSSVLDDMAQVHNKLAATAQDMYKRKLDVVNHYYKSNFTPIPFATAPAPAAPPAAAPAAAAPAPVVNAAPGFTPTQTPAPAAPAVMPDWKKAAAAAKVGDVVPIPGGKRVLKTGANSFQPLP